MNTAVPKMRAATVDALLGSGESQPEKTARLHREARDGAVKDALTRLRTRTRARYVEAAAAGQRARARAFADVIFDIDAALVGVGGES